MQSFLFFLFSQSRVSYFPIFLSNHAAAHPVNVFEKLSSFSDYSTAQTFPWFYPLYSHRRRHWPTEAYCKFPRPLVPSCVTVSSLELFHLFLLGLTPLCKSEITAKIHRHFSAKFPVRTRTLRGCNLSILISDTMLRYKLNSTFPWTPLPPKYHRAPRLSITLHMSLFHWLPVVSLIK